MGPKLSKKDFLETRAEIAALVAYAETTDYPRYNPALHDSPSSATSQSNNARLAGQTNVPPCSSAEVVPLASAAHTASLQLSTFVPPSGPCQPRFNPHSNTAAASPDDHSHSPYRFQCLRSPSPNPEADYRPSSFSARDLESPSPEPEAPASNQYNNSPYASPNLRSPSPEHLGRPTIIDLRSPSPEPEAPVTKFEKEEPPANLPKPPYSSDSDGSSSRA